MWIKKKFHGQRKSDNCCYLSVKKREREKRFINEMGTGNWEKKSKGAKHFFFLVTVDIDRRTLYSSSSLLIKLAAIDFVVIDFDIVNIFFSINEFSLLFSLVWWLRYCCLLACVCVFVYLNLIFDLTSRKKLFNTHCLEHTHTTL